MKVVIATCYESNEERVSFVLDACKRRRYDVTVVTTDFSHIKKEKRNSIPKDYVAIETKSYNKNLSINRMVSHTKLAKDAFTYIEQEMPDLIWLMVPANSLIKQAKKYKRKYPLCKIVIDVIDMWPESLPLGISTSVFPFNIWKNIRKNNIQCADKLVSECDLYQEILTKEYNKDITTLYWSRDSKAIHLNSNCPKNKLSLCYIGSINNIIDISTMSKIISNCDMPVVLHVIGEGENRYNFVNSLSKICEVIYHGPIRDKDEKNIIFSQCHAGLNIYKKGLYIGLTVKSIDYFEHGLPVINNIQGDTWSLINKYKAGINVDDSMNISGTELIEMRKNNRNIYSLYSDNFTKEIFISKCNKVIDEAME